MLRVENSIPAKTKIDISVSTPIPAKTTINMSTAAKQRRGQNMLRTNYTKPAGINGGSTAVATPIKTKLTYLKTNLRQATVVFPDKINRQINVNKANHRFD